MDQSFNTRLELDERAVIGNARDTPADSCPDGETFLNAGPRIGQQLLVAERNTLAVAIKRVLDDSALRMRLGVAARARVLDKFTWAAMAKGTVEQYRILIDSYRAGRS